MPRIADLSSQSLITARMLETQQRLFKAQIQVTSEQKSQNYSGISQQSQRLISMENSSVRMDKYIETNEVLNTRMDVAQGVSKGIIEQVSKFKDDLLKFPVGEIPDSNQVAQTQSWAFNMLKDIESLLNQDIDGQYIFSGSSRQTKPVDLGLTTLEAFQDKYDGEIIKFPETRAAHLANFELSEDPAAGPPTTDWVDFTAATGRISIPSGSTLFSQIPVGSVIDISGTTGGTNDGTYRVKTVTSTYIEVYEREFVTETTLMGVGVDNTDDTAATFTLPDGSTIDSTQYGTVDFEGLDGKIVATGANAFNGIKRGDIIEVTNHTNAALNGKYRVTEDLEADERTLRVKPATQLSAPNGTTLSVDDTGPLTFDPTTNSFSVGAGYTGSLSSLPVGQTVTIEGTVSNDGSYKILSNDGTTVTVEMDNITDSAATGPAVIKAANYYSGDTLKQDYRISDHRTVDINLNAIDPGFEKVIRALSIIAQGEYGSAGGLDKNTDRINDALYLLKDAVNQPTGGEPPYGNEEQGSIEFLQFEMGFVQRRIADANTRHTNDKGYLLNSIDNIEKVDMVEAVTNLQREAQALEASYRVFSRFQELSLNNYM